VASTVAGCRAQYGVLPAEPGVQGPRGQAAWREFTPCLAFPAGMGTVVCSTSAVESVDARWRKSTRSRGRLPCGRAVLKVLYLAVRELVGPKACGISRVAAHWKGALDAFALFFEDRVGIR
ncbi:transposase, partial [Streptomyces sp. NPDC002265]|uniref:transposase n=1 Tax=Streptomyces sp. NPDC002265 TaxID=3154415 RepID=UPI0033345368